MEFDNTNKFVLFPNDKKGNEKAPDLTGKINVDGKEFRLAAWTKTSPKVAKFLSGVVEAFDPSQKAGEPAGKQGGMEGENEENDFPF